MTEAGSPTALVRSLVAALSPTEQGLPQADILAAIESHVQIETMARAILGVPWKSATAAQRARLCAALLPMVARAMAGPFAEAHKVVLQPQRLSHAGARSEVSAMLFHPNGAAVKLSWRIELTRVGARIYDASIDGVSILDSMRSQFSEMSARDGIDALSARLEASHGGH